MEDLGFTEATVSYFMGGNFDLPDHVKNLDDLADWLQGVANEIRGWSSEPDTVNLAEVFFSDKNIDITLEKGIL